MSKPQPNVLNWEAAARLNIAENGEVLVPTSGCAAWLTHPVYHADGLPNALPDVWVRAGVYDRLRMAARALPPGYRLVLLDGWRSKALQQALYQKIRSEVAARHPEASAPEIDQITMQFAAPPSDSQTRHSPHVTGGAIDVTLADETGAILPMGSGFDEPSARSWTDAAVGSPEVERRHLLCQAMFQAGFTNLASEWWHFDYGNWVWAVAAGQPAAFYGPTSLPEGCLKI